MAHQNRFQLHHRRRRTKNTIPDFLSPNASAKGFALAPFLR
jgi:hypothetical protein